MGKILWQKCKIFIWVNLLRIFYQNVLWKICFFYNSDENLHNFSWEQKKNEKEKWFCQWKIFSLSKFNED